MGPLLPPAAGRWKSLGSALLRLLLLRQPFVGQQTRPAPLCTRRVEPHTHPHRGRPSPLRSAHSYPRASLFEVSSHSLFSRYFSESGKLVAALFARIAEAAEDEGCLVFVLVDEVESLAAARWGRRRPAPSRCTEPLRNAASRIGQPRRQPACRESSSWGGGGLPLPVPSPPLPQILLPTLSPPSLP
jgi:hypothetical protein